ncbi:SseB family protein [Actinomadura sp. 1N219]|uniref:SseB family protein n=1 Tax=Actinomadura sp. 1N219 TaxID=3375152 RepID=UPI00379F5906
MDWNDFAKRLTLELSRLPVTSFVILQGPSGLPYVQAMRSEGLFDAEAVGSAFLPRPLAPRQERRLRALGWEPPDEEERKNWWQQFTLREHRDRRDRGDRVSAEQLETSALLAGLMVGAFRDAYHIESPLELVYQASRAGPDGGPLALPGLGIPLAVPEAESDPASPSGSDLEAALADARERGDQHGYLDLLARAVLYLPAPGDAVAADHQFATARFGDGTFVLAFTSLEAMSLSLQGQAALHREASLAELARGWPHPAWQLAINPGLPSAAYLDANALLEPGAGPRGAEPAPAEAPPSDSAAAGTAPSPPESPSPPPSEPRLPTGVPEGSETLTSAPQVVIMQKAVRPEHVQHYLDGGYDLVAGYVHRVEDVAEMTTPATLIGGLGLAYEGSTFTPADEQIFVIRWPAVKPPLFRRVGAPGGPAVPEFKIESQRLPHGAGLYRLGTAGTESLVASYDADLRRWLVKLPGGSG